MGKLMKSLVIYSLITLIILGLSYIINCISPVAIMTLAPGIYVNARDLFNNLIAFVIVIPGWILTIITLILALIYGSNQYY
jgi:hypothetical protein